MQTPKAKFITLEGVDGAGKTTHLQFLCDVLREMQVPFIVTREPGGTELGEQLREIILNSKQLNITDNTELLIMFAARMQHIEEVIKPALANGQWVLCDRFTDATFAYQGGGRGVDWQRIALLRDWVQGDLVPDKTFVLDVPIEIGKQRTQLRGEQSDRFESQNDAFKQRVRAAYQRLAKEDAARIEIINSDASITQIQETLRHRLTALFKA